MGHGIETHRRRVEEAATWLRQRTDLAPRLAIILGTGLSAPPDGFTSHASFSWREIPGFIPASTTAHAGMVHIGEYQGTGVTVLAGRLHYYEGFDMRTITLPVRVAAALGATTLVVTNAAGGLNPAYRAGDIMVIRDHLNFMGGNPLRGPNIDTWGGRYPDMSAPYPARLRQLAFAAARQAALDDIVHEGVYAAVAGPSLETPAETRFLRIAGADAVGMSTVPEVIAAVHGGLEVLGLAVIANCNDPDNMRPISEVEVMAVVAQARKRLDRLIWEWVAGLLAGDAYSPSNSVRE